MTTRSTPSSILVHRLGSLGDTVIALPCFHFLRRKFPSAKIVLLTNFPVSQKAAPALTVLEGTGLIDGTIAYPMGSRSASELLAVRRTIADGHFDLGVTLCSGHGPGRTLRDAAFLKLSGVRRVVGLRAGKSNHTGVSADGAMTTRECVRLAERLIALGNVDPSDRANWSLLLTDQERAAARELLQAGGITGPFIAASLGTKVPANDWGDENWSELLRSLSRDYPTLGLVMVGSADETSRCDAMLENWQGPKLNCCSRSTPRVTAAIFESSALFIGHDSGPAHLAAAMGAPVLAMYSWHNPPGRWFPGHPSWNTLHVFYPPLPAGEWDKSLKFRRGPKEGVLLITPAEVTRRARSVLDQNPNVPPASTVRV